LTGSAIFSRAGAPRPNEGRPIHANNKRGRSDGLFVKRKRATRARSMSLREKLYSGVAFGSPLLTSPEYHSNLSPPCNAHKGSAKISEEPKENSWENTVRQRLEARTRFAELVERALEELPEEFRSRLENVQIVIEDHGSPGLLGLYHGIPQTKRNPGSYFGVLPDVITIYREPIEARARSAEQLAHEVRVTVWHEIAHHFGISDERLRELGW
jgi:predicted Zn-dependent protease with MMP-like domain